eukprot:6054480-Pyramimonas_sp.AAC.1
MPAARRPTTAAAWRLDRAPPRPRRRPFWKRATARSSPSSVRRNHVRERSRHARGKAEDAARGA